MYCFDIGLGIWGFLCFEDGDGIRSVSSHAWCMKTNNLVLTICAVYVLMLKQFMLKEIRYENHARRHAHLCRNARKRETRATKRIHVMQNDEK